MTTRKQYKEMVEKKLGKELREGPTII